MLNIYLVTRKTLVDYDQYHSFVCIAASEREAQNMLPSPHSFYTVQEHPGDWVYPDDCTATHVGTALPGDKPRVILTKYCAG